MKCLDTNSSFLMWCTFVFLASGDIVVNSSLFWSIVDGLNQEAAGFTVPTVHDVVLSATAPKPGGYVRQLAAKDCTRMTMWSLYDFALRVFPFCTLNAYILLVIPLNRSCVFHEDLFPREVPSHTIQTLRVDWKLVIKWERCPVPTVEEVISLLREKLGVKLEVKSRYII